MTDVIDDLDCVTTFDYPPEQKESDTVETTTKIINCWLDDLGWL